MCIKRLLLFTGNDRIGCDLFAALRSGKPAEECSVAPFRFRELDACLALLRTNDLILCKRSVIAAVGCFHILPDQIPLACIKPQIMHRNLFGHIIDRMRLVRNKPSVTVNLLITVLGTEQARNRNGILRHILLLCACGGSIIIQQSGISFGREHFPLVQQDFDMILGDLK